MGRKPGRRNSRRNKDLIGVIHLPALPGAPLAEGIAYSNVRAAAELACKEARILERAGFDAVILENFGDTPFFKTKVPELTIAAMSVVASQVRDAVKIPMGINVLRNDAHSALALAAANGCQFIRVNVLSGAAATDQGIIEADAATLLRARRALEDQGQRIAIFADVLVKHARTLSTSVIELAVEEVACRAGADGVIITGATTGRAVDLERLRKVDEGHCPVPVYLGSGVTLENMEILAQHCDGAIVGSALRAGAVAGAPLESRRCQAFAKRWKGL